MKPIAITDKGRLPDKEVYFCTYALQSGREIKVVVTAAELRSLKKEFNCDLEKVARWALEQAIEDDLTDNEVHLAGKTYLAVRKKLKESHCSAQKAVPNWGREA